MVLEHCLKEAGQHQFLVGMTGHFKCRATAAAEVPFHNSILANLMLYRNRLETNLLQLFARPQKCQNVCFIISLIIVEVKIVAEQNKHNGNDFIPFHKLSLSSILLIPPTPMLLWHPWFLAIRAMKVARMLQHKNTFQTSAFTSMMSLVLSLSSASNQSLLNNWIAAKSGGELLAKPMTNISIEYCGKVACLLKGLAVTRDKRSHSCVNRTNSHTKASLVQVTVRKCRCFRHLLFMRNRLLNLEFAQESAFSVYIGAAKSKNKKWSSSVPHECSFRVYFVHTARLSECSAINLNVKIFAFSSNIL